MHNDFEKYKKEIRSESKFLRGNLSEILKNFIEYKKTTISEIAKALYVDRTVISRLVNQDPPCQKEKLIKLCLYLNLKPYQIYYILLLGYVNIFSDTEENAIYRTLIEKKHEENYKNNEKILKNYGL